MERCFIVAGDAGYRNPLLYLYRPNARIWVWDPNRAWRFPDEKSANVYRDREPMAATFEVSFD